MRNLKYHTEKKEMGKEDGWMDEHFVVHLH